METLLPTIASKRELKARLGAAFSPLMGNATGHYGLELASQTDQLAARALGAAARAEHLAALKQRHQHRRGDTSQRGDFEPFRNGALNGRPLAVTGRWLATQVRAVQRLRAAADSACACARARARARESCQ